MSPSPDRRRRLTPSIVISVLALLVACSSTAVAAGLITGRDIKNNTVTTKDIKNNNLTGRDIKNGSLAFGDLSTSARSIATRDEKSLWATVAPDGTLRRGNGVVGVTADPAAGLYFVEFTRDVSTSPISVSLINDGAGDGQVNFRICGNDPILPGSCTTGGTSSAFVFVNTETSAGANADRPFTVTVGPAAASFNPPVRPAAPRGAEGRG